MSCLDLSHKIVELNVIKIGANMGRNYGNMTQVVKFIVHSKLMVVLIMYFPVLLRNWCSYELVIGHQNEKTAKH